MNRLLTFILLISSLPINAGESKKTLRIAILDTLVWEKIATKKYEADYLKGLDLAKDEARNLGYEVNYRKFSYEKGRLSILNKVKEVKFWDPHFIIGPRFSSLFLLLKDHFRNTLVVSPLATANSVSRLPENFYSISPPNKIGVATLAKFVQQELMGQSIHPIIEVDCKYCVDFARTFREEAKKRKLKLSPKDSYFLSNEVENVDIAKLITQKNEDDVFLLPNRSYTSGTLMGRISNQLKRNNVIFLGADGWGDWSAGYTGKFRSHFKYKGYRVTPWTYDKTDSQTSRYINLFERKFKTKPKGNISLISFTTVMAVVNSLPKKGLNHKLHPSEVLSSFLVKKRSVPNYGRPSHFAVYELTQEGESLTNIIKSTGAGS